LIRKWFARSFRRLPSRAQYESIRIIERLAKSENPALMGEPLGYDLKGIWKIRFGPRKAYRIVYRVLKNIITIEYIEVGHRDTIYDKLRRKL